MAASLAVCDSGSHEWRSCRRTQKIPVAFVIPATTGRMKYTLIHRGVPVGSVDLSLDADGAVDTGEVSLVPGADDFASIVREGWRVIAARRVMTAPAGSTADLGDIAAAEGDPAFVRFAALTEEVGLRDRQDRDLPHVTCALFTKPGNVPPIWLYASLPGPDAGVAARRIYAPRGISGM